MDWDQITVWLDAHRTLLVWLAAASVVLFVASLIAVPMIIARIPPDYFAHASRPRSRFHDRHPSERALLFVAKNLLGVVFMLVGFALLFTPGQGMLTMFIGFLMLDGPGKYRFERWLVTRRPIAAPINWLRRRRGREPLRVWVSE